jgi:hypothetical protein
MPITFLVASGPKSVNAPTDIMKKSRNSCGMVDALIRYQNREEIELESQSCAHNACRHEAAGMKDLFLVSS